MNKSRFISLVFFVLLTLTAFVVFNSLIPQAKPRLRQRDYQSSKPLHLNYLALGDSLTKGVGASSKEGGFVPRLAQALQDQYGYEVLTDNFGVGGNTSGQILKRLKKDKDLQAGLAKADIMTLTVGGNNIMAVLSKEITNLKRASFTKASQAYQQDLIEIIQLSRRENPDLPIYVVGVYNPYFLNFPDLKAMQDIIDQWNQGTKDTISQFKDVYFVPINDLIYKGIDGQQDLVLGQTAGERVKNNALYDKDSFHPNDVGYQIMQGAVLEKMNETSHVWQKD